MNHDDERDYEEEAANRRAMEAEHESEARCQCGGWYGSNPDCPEH